VDYLDFRNDGNVYMRIWGSNDSSAYKIISETKLVIVNSADTSDITVLTSNALQLYQKQVFGPGDYSESTIFLTK